MKFTVSYIDDQAAAAPIRASFPELAARQFLALHPRSDTSQISVESVPSAPHATAHISHFRACDLIATPSPAEIVGEEDLALQIVDSGYPDFVRSFVVAGSGDTLRLLAARLLDAVSVADSYCAPVIPTDGSRIPHCLRFTPVPDPSSLWTGSSTSRALRRDRIRLFTRLLVGVLTCIGIWTVIQWILYSQ